MLRNIQDNKDACNTYSHLYKACCEKAGLRCEHVIRNADGTMHAWNRVRIGRRWGYVDSCWYDITKKNIYIRMEKPLKSHKILQVKETYLCS